MIEIKVHTAHGLITCRHRDKETLLQTLQRHDIHLPAPCGGVGKCGKCAVRVSDEKAAGPRSPDEDRHAPAGSGLRLACRAVPQSSLSVTLTDSVKTAADDSTAKGGTINLPITGIPIIRSVELLLEPPSLVDQRSVHRRLIDELDGRNPTVSLSAVREAGSLMTDLSEPKQAAGFVISGPSGDRLVAVENTVRDALPALAIDIGTTTIAVYLLDLSSHRVLAVRSEENNQGRFGADVISRIAATGQGEDLTSVVRSQLSKMIGSLAKSAKIKPDGVLAATVVGNPTMIHLLFGLNPDPIGRAPFMPLSTEQLDLSMVALGLPAHPEATIVAAPGLSAYVGADIVADILASRMNEAERLSLLIDIGTNGEMVLGDSRGLIACSTAAGPAFEGANIRCGSGGIAGAIDEVLRDGDALVLGTIGDEPPKSICGTGLMDLVALLLEDGIVDETGRMDLSVARSSPAYKDRITERDGENALIVTTSGEPEEVVLTQGDVRQVQLAKGAIAAGVRTLLKEAGVNARDITTVHLAGGFGTYVRPESALRVGLLPSLPVERVTAIGNAAGAGAARLLIDSASMEEANRIVTMSRYIELSRSESFQNFFIDEMIFP